MIYNLIFVASFVAVTVIVPSPARANTLDEKCATKTKVNVSQADAIHAGNFSIETENEPLKKYVLCMMVTSELMTKDGKFQKDVALAKVQNESNKPALEQLIDTCLANKGNTPQQTAWNYIKCFHEKGPKHPILVQTRRKEVDRQLPSQQRKYPTTNRKGLITPRPIISVAIPHSMSIANL